MKLDEVKVDLVKQEEGDWIENIPDLGDVRVKVRGADNKDWRKLRNKLFQSIPRNKRLSGQIDPDETDRITSILLRDTCLLDWANVEIGGVAVPFSKEMANELLTDAQWVVFRDGVAWAANEVVKQQAAVLGTDAKN